MHVAPFLSQVVLACWISIQINPASSSFLPMPVQSIQTDLMIEPVVSGSQSHESLLGSIQHQMTAAIMIAKSA